MRKKCFDHRDQLDLFKVATVVHFPLHRRAALVRGVAEFMSTRATHKQTLGFLSREMSCQFAELLRQGLSNSEARHELALFRDKVLSAYHRMTYAPSSRPSEGDDAA